MAGVRCPMCSHLNLEEAEICEVCGARLKPLRIIQPPGSSTAQADSESHSVQGAGEQPPENEWLARFRKEDALTDADHAEPERVTAELKHEPKPDIQPESRPKTEPESSETDWISRFRTEAMHEGLFSGIGEPQTEQPEPHIEQPELQTERLESQAERLEPQAERLEPQAEQPEPQAER